MNTECLSNVHVQLYCALYMRVACILFIMLQLLMTVLTRGEVTEIMSLAVTAAQCMNRVAISKEIREFSHRGKADGKFNETVSLFSLSPEPCMLQQCHSFFFLILKLSVCVYLCRVKWSSTMPQV